LSKAVTYEKAPELISPVRDLIEEFHPHLKDAKVATIYRVGKWFIRGKKEKGKAMIVPAIWQCLTGLDLLLVVNKKAYLRQNQESQLAMLDELLCRFADTDSTRYETCEPDIQEFSDIVNRRNVCFSNLDLIAAGSLKDEIQKIELGDDDDDDEEEAEELEEIGEDAEDITLDVWVENYDEIDHSQEKVLKVMEFDK
jgi:hypothetical protein